MPSEGRSPSPVSATAASCEQQDAIANSESAVGQKRKSRSASNDPETDTTAKRPRTDVEKTHAQDNTQDHTMYDDPPHHNLKESAKLDLYDRRKNFTQEEKKRGKRLFGGLLNTLSQRTTSTQQRRRQEIERRQQERAQKERSEDDKHRSEKLIKLKRIREAEQIKYEERVMRTRHQNMLAMANSLKTRATPPVYYVPYQLTRDQEDQIDDQIHDTKVTIRNEVEEFQRQATRRLKQLGFDPPPERPKSLGGGSGEKKAEGPSAPALPSPEHPSPPKAVDTTSQQHAEESLAGTKSVVEAHHKEHPDDNGDVVLEAEEDTVIY